MLVELDDEHTKCGICIAKFSSDRDNKDPEIKKHLPVLSSSQRCDHWFCHGCILREQLRVAEENNGKIPKWIRCMHCREKTSFNPTEPKYHRLLIDLLARAQKYAAAQVKTEQTEVEENETTDVTTVKQEQNNEFHDDYAASEGKVDGKRDDADDDGARSVKREGDAYGKPVVKRPKLTTPSPPLVRVKEEPIELDDDDNDEATTSLERRAPINGIDTSATNADYTPAAPKVEDKDQLMIMCSDCNVARSLDCFSKTQKRKGKKRKCMNCTGYREKLEKREAEEKEERSCFDCYIVKKKEEFDIIERKKERLRFARVAMKRKKPGSENSTECRGKKNRRSMRKSLKLQSRRMLRKRQVPFKR